MKNLNIFFEDYEFSKMLKLKAKLGITWKAVITRGLTYDRRLMEAQTIKPFIVKLKGGKDGKNKN